MWGHRSASSGNLCLSVAALEYRSALRSTAGKPVKKKTAKLERTCVNCADSNSSALISISCTDACANCSVSRVRRVCASISVAMSTPMARPPGPTRRAAGNRIAPRLVPRSGQHHPAVLERPPPAGAPRAQSKGALLRHIGAPRASRTTQFLLSSLAGPRRAVLLQTN